MDFFFFFFEMSWIFKACSYKWGFSGGASGRDPPANAEDITDVGSIPGLGRFSEEGIEIHSTILAWRIPRTKEPGRL